MDNNKKITITEKDFMEASSKAISNEAIMEMMKVNPILLLFSTVISAEIAKQLFKEETAESESEGET